MTLPRSSKRSIDGRRSKLAGLMPVLVTRFSKSRKRAIRRSVEGVMPLHGTSRRAARLIPVGGVMLLITIDGSILETAAGSRHPQGSGADGGADLRGLGRHRLRRSGGP